MANQNGNTPTGPASTTTPLPESFVNVDIQSLTHLIADVLTRLVAHNDQIPLTSSNLTRFHSRAPPGISIAEYLRRIVKYASVERVCLLILLIYIDRVCEQHRTFMISSLTVHRFVITACTIASKALCDSYLTNTMYAKVGGLSTKELNLLELEMCFLIEWNLTASAELLQQYYSRLARQAHSSYKPRPLSLSLLENLNVATTSPPSATTSTGADDHNPATVSATVMRPVEVE
ncbi:hypothetical protein SmJEL517_g04255 [Synchytrium microbalum]|uniref:Cyclin n=1 Tax=Synchytrium microbalum TaxID=1806994 RepID=A0A507C5L6_9FUNG|nr:uncharacterized protein SmJEL517_g04255 [Synchytrium microbalum]TPX32755.1 hypothetical protein SmJEL517_g04255 [Synchytrium microbalum]